MKLLAKVMKKVLTKNRQVVKKQVVYRMVLILIKVERILKAAQ